MAQGRFQYYLEFPWEILNPRWIFLYGTRPISVLYGIPGRNTEFQVDIFICRKATFSISEEI